MVKTSHKREIVSLYIMLVHYKMVKNLIPQEIETNLLRSIWEKDKLLEDGIKALQRWHSAKELKLHALLNTRTEINQ